jgi:hypothetical protein
VLTWAYSHLMFACGENAKLTALFRTSRTISHWQAFSTYQ